MLQNQQFSTDCDETLTSGTDRQTDRQTDGQTDRRTSSTLYPLVFTGDKYSHNLCFGVDEYTCHAIYMKDKKWFKNWSRFRVVHLLVEGSEYIHELNRCEIGCI